MAKIFHAHLHGDRDTKYDRLMHSTIGNTSWSELLPQNPFYLLIPQDNQLLEEYERGWKITEIMPMNSVGIVTARDPLTIHWTEEETWQTINEFVSLDPEQAREKYSLGDDARDWKVSMAQSDLKKSGLSKEKLSPILYRPFDIRHTYYTGNSRGFHCMPRGEVMRHILAGNNASLMCMRQVSPNEDFNHFMVTNSIVHNRVLYSSKGMMIIAPLYLYFDSNKAQQKLIKQPKKVNLSLEFLAQIEQNLGYTPTPEAIFYYIYAIFHSPTYRSRYAEFLKIDFPRVPLTRNDALFRQLAAYGEELVALHLMKSAKLEQKN